MDEREPVEDSEFVYRRIHETFFDSSLPIPVRRAAFKPNQHDTVGISVFRSRFLRAVDTLANIDPVKAGKYLVAQLSVSELRRLGLTIVPDPVPGGPPGHAVLPELSWDNYHARQEPWKVILAELAKLASAGIVYRPKGEP